jgi:transketolase
LRSARKTGGVVTCEEHSIIGGLGSAVAELLGEHAPRRIVRVGVRDVFGTSGEPDELMAHFGLTAHDIADTAEAIVIR